MESHSSRRPARELLRGALLLAVAMSVGCTSYWTPFETDAPKPNPPTRVTQELRDLPAPDEQIVAAVYRFRDQTGQYQPSQTGTSFSRAVTQGATSILVKALEESGWFVPIEREGLSNLLNERQIIQQMRADYQLPEGQQEGREIGQLPPMLYAGVLLEGGIIGYNSNTLTGGTAARYFGAGGSGQFRQDQVTVYLRAVSTQTGRVLKTVHTTKTLLSQEVETGIFRFVEPDRLLEAETGFSFNEPTVVAVTEAIEAAVKSLVIEGVRDELWSLADPADLGDPIFQQYDRQQALAAETDRFGRFVGEDRTGAVLGVTGGAQRYQGNFENPLARPSAGVSLGFAPTPRVQMGFGGSLGKIAAEGSLEDATAAGELFGLYHFLPDGTVSPFVQLGAGLLVPDMRDFGTDFGEQLFPYAMGGAGLEYLVHPSVGLSATLQNQYMLMDGIDGVKEGNGNDSVWRLVAGLNLYLSQF